ncbi:MAG: hypothetical protein JEZ06_04640, partial [Anaerolineaceae bacterium]|nr:hypothetical protein [Anaerolineaceae bacterium]
DGLSATVSEAKIYVEVSSGCAMNPNPPTCRDDSADPDISCWDFPPANNDPIEFGDGAPSTDWTVYNSEPEWDDGDDAFTKCGIYQIHVRQISGGGHYFGSIYSNWPP